MTSDEQGFLSAATATGAGPLVLDLNERKDSLVGKIAADIASDIADGVLRPGADLNSVELASRFGTSRTPVREALMLLEKEGLVEIPARRRPRVAHISMTEVDELYEIRSVLNDLMIREFIARATVDDLADLRNLVTQGRTAAAGGAVELAFDYLDSIHVLCLQRCGNGSLIRLLDSWKMRMSVRRLAGSRKARLDRALLDHERLVIACEERDSPLASHLIQSMTHIGLSAIKQHQKDLAERQAEAAPAGKPRKPRKKNRVSE